MVQNNGAVVVSSKVREKYVEMHRRYLAHRRTVSQNTEISRMLHEQHSADLLPHTCSSDRWLLLGQPDLIQRAAKSLDQAHSPEA